MGYRYKSITFISDSTSPAVIPSPTFYTDFHFFPLKVVFFIICHYFCSEFMIVMNNHARESHIEMFVVDFIEQLNNISSLGDKIQKQLDVLCLHFRFSRGFIYQTDGFRFLQLKECCGDKQGRERIQFEQSDLSPAHRKSIFHTDCIHVARQLNPTEEELDILHFYQASDLAITPIRDAEGALIGTIGMADRETEEPMTADELRIFRLLSGLLAKEITIREYQEREVRARKTLESIMNNMGVDIYVNSFDSHDMLYANASMAAPYGGIDHFRNKKCWQALYTDKTGECDFCPKKHIIDEEGKPSKVYSWDYQRPFDGAWFRVFSAAFDWIDGQLAHVITSVDITNQKNIEGQLIVAKEKAEQMDRLKSAFLANMSHEIRTPLNAIVGFSSLLAETEEKEDRDDYLHIVEQNNALLLQLISDILDLSKIEAGTLSFETDTIQTLDLCNDIVRSYQIKGSGVPVLFDPETPDYIIRSDRKRLTQVVTNFINNALKFTTEGNVTLSYHLLEEEGMIEFSVRDSGIGIPADKVDKVFDRFMKVSTFSQGTGLGLSICKSIIDQFQGTIGVESEEGKGSRFWFKHPYQPSPS